jgi:ubiquinone/menaquinone biosynthesis C-methylase UbiE
MLYYWDELIDIIKDSRLEKILYVGFGDDYEGLEKLALVASRVIGIDIRLCQLGNCPKERKALLEKYQNLDLIVADARNMPFRPYAFDGIFYINCMVSIAEWRKNKNSAIKALKEAYNALKDYGTVMICENEEYQKQEIEWDKNFFLIEEEMNMLREVGFSSVKNNLAKSQDTLIMVSLGKS